jgi:histone-lysine N-methyltransferase SETMAR
MMLIVFFDIQSIVTAECVPSGQTVNQHCYLEVLMKLRESVRRKRPELWRTGWILHQDNAPAHNALSGKEVLANHSTTVLEYPPYSPDLAPCDFHLFSEIKSVLKGTYFFVGRSCESKNRRRSSTAFQKVICRIALDVGSIVCSCVLTQKGTILKDILVDFL